MRASAGPASGRVGAARRSSPDEHEEEEVDAEEPERGRGREGEREREREEERGRDEAGGAHEEEEVDAEEPGADGEDVPGTDAAEGAGLCGVADLGGAGRAMRGKRWQV